MRFPQLFQVLFLLIACSVIANGQNPSGEKSDNAGKGDKRVHELRVLVLSTMLADAGIGEWGYAAIVEADGHRILFDTGANPDTVLKNAKELGVDLATVKDVILSHNHSDHTNGLMTLRREFAK